MTAAATLTADPEVLWQRVLDRVTVTTNGCWQWSGARNSKGYGCVSSGRHAHAFLTHRLAVIVRDGAIPEGLTVDHTCHNTDPTCPGGNACLHRLCVNPTHLDPVPIRVNLERAGLSGQTHCDKGHELIGANVFVHRHGSKPATRGCRACRRNRDAARRAA